MNLSIHAKQAAALFGDRVAIEQGDLRWTYEEFDRIVDRLASGLVQRYAPLSRVGVMMSNRVEAVFLQFALERARLIRVPVNARYTGHDLALLMRDCHASAVFFDEVCKPEVLRAQLPAAVEQVCVDGSDDSRLFEALMSHSVVPEMLHLASLDDLATINYTSGTTGKPKGVMLSHRNWVAVYRNMLIDRDFREDDVVAVVGPLTHSAGAYLAPWFWRGAKSIIVTPPTPERLLDLIEQERVTAFTCVPTFLTRLVNQPSVFDRDLSSIRLIGYGAEPIPLNTLQKAWRLFGPVLWQNYGQTEAMMTCLHLPPEDHLHIEAGQTIGFRHGYIGRPYTFVEAVLRDSDGNPVPDGEVGELTLRADHIMQGYWNRPDLTREATRDGWLWTGDLAIRESARLFRLVGRRKDMLICGGFNIYPAELESLLTGIEGVSEAAVIARDDADWGEIAVAFVATSINSPLTIEDLIAAVRPMAGIKTPKAWHLLDELPKNANGKLDKNALRLLDRQLMSRQSREEK
ncbi:MAG: AMP-binding protein [Burkholderiaceae bacterium]|nr:AMP-binding protein [Burkholderiaceae bacterium]